MKKKLLVAIDGSPHSNNILDYLGQLFGYLGDARLHLLCIVPCIVCDAGREWLDELDLMSMISPQGRENYAKAKRYMESAIKRLEQNGVEAQQIKTEVRLARSGVAADLIAETHKELYDALVIGRRGLSAIEEMIMGSVSHTILEKCHDVPIWLVDGKVDSCKILVPVDGSYCVLKALDHLSFILQDNPCAEITLFHSDALLGHKQKLDPAICREYLDEDWCEEHKDCPDCTFHAPERLLLNNGIPKVKIHYIETNKGVNPSNQIIRQALLDGFGTIVMGRRAAEEKKGLFGSVSGKVAAMASDTAVWLVG